MPFSEVINRRFNELDAQMNGLRPQQDADAMCFYDTEAWQQWTSSVQHLIQCVFGEMSSHYRNFTSAYEKCNGWQGEVNAMKGIFRAAMADYKGGYIFSYQAIIAGEVYGDFIILAKNALAEGFKDVAAVLACAALEDALKRFAQLNELEVSEKVMQEVVSALKSKGLVGGAQKSLLDAMPKIRDYAMHANWEKITQQDVGSVIGFVEQLLLNKFSGGQQEWQYQRQEPAS